jgi:hypothetical protein
MEILSWLGAQMIWAVWAVLSWLLLEVAPGFGTG